MGYCKLSQVVSSIAAVLGSMLLVEPINTSLGTW